MWQVITKILFATRTWARATIWGDRVCVSSYISHGSADIWQLFLQFQGPSTILLQTRASRIRDVLTLKDMNEMADAQPGTIQPFVALERDSKDLSSKALVMPQHSASKAPSLRMASITSDGKVTFEPIKGSE